MFVNYTFWIFTEYKDSAAARSGSRGGESFISLNIIVMYSSYSLGYFHLSYQVQLRCTVGGMNKILYE